MLLAVLVSSLTIFASGQGPASANYDESKVGTYTLPDPLTFNDGKKVRNALDWERRRIEIVKLFQENVYGRNPQPPKQIDFTVFDSGRSALGGKAVRKQVAEELPELISRHQERMATLEQLHDLLMQLKSRA